MHRRHPDTVETLNNYGDFLTECGQLEELKQALQFYEQGLTAAIERMGYLHPQVAMLLKNIIETLENNADALPDAETQLRKYEAMWQKSQTARYS